MMDDTTDTNPDLMQDEVIAPEDEGEDDDEEEAETPEE